MNRVQVGPIFSEAWRLISANWAYTLIGGLLVAAISAVATMVLFIPVLIVGPPLYFGFTYGFLRIKRGEPISISNAFDGFNEFGNCLGAGLLAGIAILIGTILLVIPGIYLYILWSILPLVVMDRKIGGGQALSESSNLVYGHKTDILVVRLLEGLIFFAVNSITGGFGVIITLPFDCAITTAIYTTVAGKEKKQEETIEGQSPTDPITP